MSPAQQEFNQTYITSGEIAKIVDVARSSVHHARKRGDLPNPIIVGDDLTCIWKRAEIQPYIDTWLARLGRLEPIVQ